MTFEDRLREQFRRADASIPGERIDWSTTIAKARRNRMRYAALTTAAAVLILGIGAFALVSLDEDPAPGPGPATTDGTDQPQPETTVSASESPSGERTCSASGMQVSETDSSALPDPVAATRAAIIELAIDCQYEGLEGLALEGDPIFSYSFGDDGSPARFWQQRERDARRNDAPTSEYMRYLVSILQLPHCVETPPDGKTYYVWPRVHCSDRTAEDWNDLEGLYPAEEIEQMRDGDIYYGFRVGILENGDWVYFIAGD